MIDICQLARAFPDATSVTLKGDEARVVERGWESVYLVSIEAGQPWLTLTSRRVIEPGDAVELSKTD
jgi:hypothetical protein